MKITKLSIVQYPSVSGYFLFMAVSKSKIHFFMSIGSDCVSDLRPPTGLLLCPRDMSMEIDGGIKKTEELGKNCHSTTLSTTNPTWIDPDMNRGSRGQRPVINRLSHGTA
jgi:hypothetical protein